LINTLLGKVFGTKNEREVKRLQPRVGAINALEAEMQKLSDEQLRAKTGEFRARIEERLRSIADAPENDAGRPDTERPGSAAIFSKRFSMNCWKKRLRWCAKRESACLTCGTSTCS